MKKMILLTVAMLGMAALFAQNQFITTDAGEQIPYKEPVKIPQNNVSKGAGSLTTLFTGGNGQDGVMFDLTNNSGNALTITSMDLNLEAGTMDVLFYYVNDTYANHNSIGDLPDWTLISTNNVTSLAENTPTAVDITDFVLPAGQTYGMYITVDHTTYTQNIRYTSDLAPPTIFSDANLTLTAGCGVKEDISFAYSNRIFNGTIYYSGDAVLTPLSPWMILLGLVLFAGIAVVGRRFL